MVYCSTCTHNLNINKLTANTEMDNVNDSMKKPNSIKKNFGEMKKECFMCHRTVAEVGKLSFESSNCEHVSSLYS